jgi:hypothetical protein
MKWAGSDCAKTVTLLAPVDPGGGGKTAALQKVLDYFGEELQENRGGWTAVHYFGGETVWVHGALGGK